MKPNFALSLSFEGIRLLHRAAGGWRRVGEVSVHSEKLSDDLAALRVEAGLLEQGPLRTKLIIPDDQIKYLSVETGPVDKGARQDAARKALDGATPYAVDALVFDICEDGAQTHMAAVARETLVEAEAFASEHFFHPVCFVAAPAEQAFLGEPWFGEAAHARAILADGEQVEPDGVRVVVVGDATAAPPEPEAVESATETPRDADATTKEPVTEKGEASAETGLPDAGASGETEPHVDETQLMGFASRRGEAAAPALGGVTRDAPERSQFEARKPGKAPETPPADVAASLNAKPDVSEQVHQPKDRKGGFLSRRKKAQDPPADTAHASVEAERMTVFGARDQARAVGKPRYLGLVLTAILIVFMAGVAAWASVYFDDRIAAFLQRDRTLASTLPDDAAPTLAEDVGATTPLEVEEPTEENLTVASLNEDLADGLSAEDAAVLDALRDPLPAPQPPEAIDAAELDARYAVTGIWPRAPEAPDAPAVVPREEFYLTGIDPVSPALDAVALPGADTFVTDARLPDVANPPAAGTRIARDAEGFIVPTADGTVSPDGYTVFLGRPPLVPPDTPTRSAADPGLADRNVLLAVVRPRSRPDDLIEQNERATLGGLLRSELATYRPKLRPPAPQDLVQPESLPETDNETDAAVAALALPPTEPLLRPSARPRNFDRIVARAQSNQTERASGTQVASIAPRTVTPSIPSSASVTREATVQNAINLRRVNLIGVYGTPSDRRALVRLGNGRYQKVQVGDRFDGGRVSAIGDSELRYQKGGKNVVLKMPSG